MSFRVTLDTSLSTNIDTQEVYCPEMPSLSYTVQGDVGTIYYDGYTGRVGFYATPLGSNTMFMQWEYYIGTNGAWQVSTENPFYYNGDEDITIYAVGVAANNTVRVTLRDGSYDGGSSDIEYFIATITDGDGNTQTLPALAFSGGTKDSAYADVTPGQTLKIVALLPEGKTFLGWQYSYQSPSGLRFAFWVPNAMLNIKVLADTTITACTSGLIQLYSGGWQLAAQYIYSGGEWQRTALYVKS